MKISSNLVLLFFLGLSLSLQAQNQIEDYVFIGVELDKEWKTGDLSLFSEGTFGSNAINSQIFRDVLFNPTFDLEAKSTFLEAEKNRTNLYSNFQNRIDFKLDSSIGIFVSNQWQVGYYSEKQFSDLLLFGNAQFEGVNVSTDNLGFIQSNATKVGLGKKIIDTEKTTIVGSAGLNLVHQYARINSENSSLYTAQDGEYLDVKASELSYTSTGNGIVAIGLNIDVDLIYRLNESHSIDVSVANLNFNRALDASYASIDTNFRFEGVQFDVFSEESQFSANLDSTIQGEINSRKSAQQWISLPTNLSISWNYLLKSKNRIIIGAETIEWGDFGVNAYASYYHNFGSKFRLASTVGYGNFNGIIWNEALEFRSKKGCHFMVQVFGIHSILAPMNTYNFGLSAGVSKNIL